MKRREGNPLVGWNRCFPATFFFGLERLDRRAVVLIRVQHTGGAYCCGAGPRGP